ncbi:ribonuclease J [archaeon]|nr:ribonuclease J [archaeon]|tara:strand:- start:638 stop:1966 length:1329 start_codon:yes stop_codon:yes gene_type:complete
MKVYTIGGFSEVGKNMCAVEIEDEIVIFDMGLYLPKLLNREEEGDTRELSTNELIKIGVLPDDTFLEENSHKVKAIVISHAHLDHVGAAPYLAAKYDCPIIGTPYTIEILKTMVRDNEVRLKNKYIALTSNDLYKISDNIKLEFVNMTHSTVQVVLCALHSDEGIFVYANDFKFDNNPGIGKAPNYKKLEELGKKGVKVAVIDALNSKEEKRTPSEKIAKELLKDVMYGVNAVNKVILVTTFSSHIPRLKSIIEFGKHLNRNIVFLGRSLHKYVSAAQKLGIVDFKRDIELIGYSNSVKKKLSMIEKNRDKYIIVCTGNQGEPGSILSRLSKNELPFGFKDGDIVIFSCRTIPTPETIANRELLERKLKQKKARIFKDIHVSGHLAREDHRDFINMMKPEHIIPAHGDIEKLTGLSELATEMGYKFNKTIHVMQDGSVLEVK